MGKAHLGVADGIIRGQDACAPALVKTFIICNPGAGGVDDSGGVIEKLEAFPSSVVSVTNGAGEATQLARQAVAEGFDFIVAAGGDGTLNEVVNGIAESVEKVRVGLVPLGTGNDFARMLALPDSIEACLDVLAQGHVKPIDLVRVTSDQARYFVNVSAGGFSGTVNEKLTPEIKKSWGPLAYLRCAAEALPELRAYRTTIVLDDTATLEFDLYNAIVANGRFVAGGTAIAPEASIDDGLLDLVLVPKAAAGDIAVVAAQIMMGTHLSSDAVVFRRAAKIAVHSSPGMWFNVDGELVGNDPAVFEVMPRVLQFVVPQEA